MKKKLFSGLAIVLFICGSRVIPHLANFSPLVCLALFMGYFVDKRLAYILLIIGMVLSDILLAKVMHYPLFGTWSLFIYSGLITILFIGTQMQGLQERFMMGLGVVLFADFGFWLWTNFGVWLFSGMYGLHVDGLVTCFNAALPFLQYSMMGTLTWYLILVAGMWTTNFCKSRWLPHISKTLKKIY